MKNFTKPELKSISLILSILFVVVAINMLASLRKGRDSIRKNDLSYLEKALDTYYQKYQTYPKSSEKGEIIGCFSGLPSYDEKTGVVLNAEVCKWGESKFEGENYMPTDPRHDDGFRYYYSSDGSKYELYIALEGKDEAEYSEVTFKKNLHCGTKVCNYGRVIESKK